MTVQQDGIEIIQEQGSIVIKTSGATITLSEENKELLRLMLFDMYKAQKWKLSRAERSARNKALWAKMKSSKVTGRTTTEYPEYDIDFSNIDGYLPKLPDF